MRVGRVGGSLLGLEETWELEDLGIWGVLGAERARRITGLGWGSGVGLQI